jgi:hypothetical protein
MQMAGRSGSGSAASSLASGRIMDGPGQLQFAERSPHSQPVISGRLAAAIDLC